MVLCIACNFKTFVKNKISEKKNQFCSRAFLLVPDLHTGGGGASVLALTAGITGSGAAVHQQRSGHLDSRQPYGGGELLLSDAEEVELDLDYSSRPASSTRPESQRSHDTLRHVSSLLFICKSFYIPVSKYLNLIFSGQRYDFDY